MIVLIFTLGIFILFLVATSFRQRKGKANIFTLKKDAMDEINKKSKKEDSTVQEMFDILNKKKDK